MSVPLSTAPIDLIGDIHGHADELEALLKKLGYAVKNGSYAHPERTVLFVGDYIDRGPKIRETLDLVRRMVEAGFRRACAPPPERRTCPEFCVRGIP